MTNERARLPRLERSFSQQIDVVHASDPGHGSNLLKGLHKLYNEQRHCDITLDFGKGKRIRAHRVVLASFSSYFDARLGSNWEEGEQGELELHGFDETEVSNLIEFAYSGNIDISTENVQNLLEAANYLGVEFVQNSCVEFLKKAIDEKTCFGILCLADFFSLRELKSAAKRYCLRHFSTVCREEEFLSLAYDHLVELLKNDELCVVIDDLIPPVEEREKIVLQAVLSYVDHDLTSRRDYLPELLLLVRLPTLTKAYLQEISCHKLVIQNKCTEILSKAQKFKDNKTELGADNSGWTQPRKFAQLETIWGRTFASGGQVQPEIKTFSDRERMENTDEDVYIKGMKLWIRRWDGRPVLGGVKIFYSNSTDLMCGGNTADESYEFHLEENEKIIQVEVQSGWMIDRLTFYTNKKDSDGKSKMYGPFGGGGGAFYPEHPAGSFGYLAGMAGAEVHSQGELGITKLQFAWKTFVFPGDPKPPNGRCTAFDDLVDSYSDATYSEEDYEFSEAEEEFYNSFDRDVEGDFFY